MNGAPAGSLGTGGRQLQKQLQRRRLGWEMGFIPTHDAMKLRHGWGTRWFFAGQAERQQQMQMQMRGFFAALRMTSRRNDDNGRR
jgi:hypothetical protein